MSSVGKSSLTRRVPSSPVAVGELVADKYRVEKILAAGGMGVVVAARHLGLDQPVALKFLIPLVQDEETVARFLREARAAARLQSEHVVRVFDCGSIPSGVPFMAMELLEGRELAVELRERGPLPVCDAVDILLETLEGVAAAHAAGIVHRDLKPSNIFLATRPGGARVVKVLDFGISKVSSGPDAPIEDDLTGTAMMLGSPRYISPEQAQSSRDVDQRTDIWSLGVVLYELLDGKSPFAGNTMGEVLGKILLYRPEAIDKKRDDVPPGLSEVIERCLQRDRTERCANVAELARALEPFASTRGKSHVPRIAALLGADSGPAASPADSTLTRKLPASGEVFGEGTQTTFEAPPKAARSSLWMAGAAAALIAAGTALSYFAFAAPSADEPPIAAAAPPSGAPASAPPASSAVEARASSEPAVEPAPTVSSAPTASAPPSASAVAPAHVPAARPSGAATSRPRPTNAPPSTGVLDRSD